MLALARHGRAERLDVVEDRILAEVVADDVRHQRIDRLVVGAAIARRVGQRHASLGVGAHEPGHAEHAVGQEELGIEIGVVDAPIDDVDPLGPLGRAHVDRVALDEQVARFDQLDAHVACQKGVLEVGRVERPGRQQDRARLVAARR